MAKPNYGAGDRYQPPIECRLQNIHCDLCVDVFARGAQDIADARLLVQRGEQQRGLRVYRQSRRLGGERALQPFRERKAPQCALTAIGPLTLQGTRQLQQCERVAEGLVEDKATRLMVELRRHGAEQFPRGGLTQRSHVNLWQMGRQNRGLKSLAQPHDEQDVG